MFLYCFLIFIIIALGVFVLYKYSNKKISIIKTDEVQ